MSNDPQMPAVEPLDLHGVYVSTTSVAAVRRLMGDLADQPSYPYPWADLESDIEGGAMSRLSLVGYGSLMNVGSAARTITATGRDDRVPVIAFGVRRVFDYEMPASDDNRYGPPTEPRACAALNVHITRAITDTANGVLIKVPTQDIAALRRRETGYHIEPVVCLRWDRLNAAPFVAHILTCQARAPGQSQHTNDRLTPHHQYYLVCREGARAVSESFLRFFLETTFLADGITAAAKWELAAFASSSPFALGHKPRPRSTRG